MTTAEIGGRLRGGLIVSCQALPGEALFGADIMARMAVAAERGGAVGIRANSPADIAAIRAATTLPLIGLSKVDVAGYEVYITPTLADAVAVSEASADIVALDATQRPAPRRQPGVVYPPGSRGDRQAGAGRHFDC